MKMNHRQLLFFLLILSLSILSGCSGNLPNSNTSDEQTFFGEGFTLTFPQSWTSEENLIFEPSVDNKYLAITSHSMDESEVPTYIDSEIQRILSGEEADNAIKDPLAQGELKGLSIFRFSHVSKMDGAAYLIYHAFIYDGMMLHGFNAVNPPMSQDEFDSLVDSFTPLSD